MWTVTDIAARLGVTAATVRSYKHRGLLPPARYVGRTPVWRAEEIETWIRQRPGRGAGGGRPRRLRS
ncbi:hypothetical protein CGQ36_06535 [Nocardiopsis dassonvillei]|nr:hypothetical protein CGQ36_06535 [Nocardiopsis dassonvillei]